MRAQETVEAHAELGRLDLERVAWAHRRDRIGSGETGLHVADLAPKLVALGGEALGGEAELRDDFGIEETLKGEVVDRHHPTRRVAMKRRSRGVEQRRTALPVVRVHDVGPPVELVGDPDCGFPEQREAARVVGEIAAAARSVETIAIEGRRVLDEPDARARVSRVAPLEEPDLEAFWTELHGEDGASSTGAERRTSPPSAIDAIARQRDDDLVPQRRQLGR